MADPGEPDPRPGASSPLAWLALAAAALLLTLHTLQYNFVTDDAFISFVFARNFAEHGELVFNLGDPVEGYTNFLWTFVLGVLMAVDIPPEWSARVLAWGCALVTLGVTYRLLRRVHVGEVVSVLPALLLASSSGFACWTSGGLETQLFAMLVVLAIAAFVDGDAAGGRLGLWLALAAMTRPEGLLVAAVLGGHRLAGNLYTARRLLPSRGEWRTLMVFAALWLPWFGWRWQYYGHFWPNTYYVKAHGPWQPPSLAKEMWGVGVHYVEVWARQSNLRWAAPWICIAVVASFLRIKSSGSRREWTLASVLAVLSGVYLVYAMSVGGDFMGLHRFIMPVSVAMALLVGLGVSHAVKQLPASGTARGWVGGIVAVVLTALFAQSQWRLTGESLRPGNLANDRGIDTPAFLKVYTDDRATIGKAMAPCFAPGDLSIVGGAGAQPYYGRMKAIDAFGLVSERVAHEEPRIRARAGHTKFASERLLAEHDPTFVFSCYDIHRQLPAPRLPCAGFWLGRGYEQVTMHIPGLRERGEYYTFLAKKERAFTCPGRVP